MNQILSIQNLSAFYGKSQVLRGLTLGIGEGETVSLLGRNGAGRSTALKCISGVADSACGVIEFDGTPILGLSPHRIANLGLSHVPEERNVFQNLTVAENLVVAESKAARSGRTWKRDDVFGYFPKLRTLQNTRAGVLSGGEQQMLTIGRALLRNPSLMLVDEPTEGLAPKIVAQIADVLRDVKSRGAAILLVEQKLTIALAISDRVAVVGHGAIVFDGSADAFSSRPEIARAWLAAA